MADRQQPSRRGSSGKRASEHKEITPPRRGGMLRCENCGEDYASDYKRCPFCDDRPGRPGITGQRTGGRGPVHPIQVIGLVISLVLIITALFIVFKKVGPLVFGDGSGRGSSVSSSQSAPGSSGDLSGSGSGDLSQPEVPQVTVNSLILDKTEFTLRADETYQMSATVDPAGAPVTWTSSDPQVLTVDENGMVRNVNTGSQKAKATITASAGDKTAQCLIYCRPGSTGTGASTGGETGNNSTGPVAPNSKGTIVNAGDGLNIRSGPGSSYDKVASGPNGAEVTILGEENGWYKIDYGGGKTGYVSKDYIRVG